MNNYMTKENKFKVGDRVSFMDEAGTGIVLEVVDQTKVKVKNSDGFEMIYLNKKLVPLAKSSDFKIHEAEEFRFIRGKIKADSSNKKKKSLPAQSKSVWEINLHIEELIKDYRHLSNGEILDIQMRKFAIFISSAMDKKIQKVVIIHGKGEGVLKNEIRTALFAYGNMEIHDASYTKYGQGATEVLIRYNF